jgi:hypothetical protein
VKVKLALRFGGEWIANIIISIIKGFYIDRSENEILGLA